MFSEVLLVAPWFIGKHPRVFPEALELADSTQI